MRYRILNVEATGYSRCALAILRERADVDLRKDLDERGIASVIGRYDGVIVRLKNYIGESVFSRASKLRFIATATTGTDHIDLKAANHHAVTVLSLKGEVAFLRTIHATAEHTIALILALARKLPAAVVDVRRGRWRRDRFIGTELYGKTLGIAGYGRVGAIVARYGHALGMRVMAFDAVPGRIRGVVEPVSFATLLRKSDVLSVHLPLDPTTEGLFDGAAFGRMDRRPLFINTSRGAIVKTPSLLSALSTGAIRGAALDVLDRERDPLAGQGALLAAARSDNLIITPHIGGATRESMEKTEIFMAEKIVRFLAREAKRHG